MRRAHRRARPPLVEQPFESLEDELVGLRRRVRFAGGAVDERIHIHQQVLAVDAGRLLRAPKGRVDPLVEVVDAHSKTCVCPAVAALGPRRNPGAIDRAAVRYILQRALRAKNPMRRLIEFSGTC